MRQPREDRALYYRQLRQTINHVFAPELTSAQALDAVGLVDRLLAEFIVEEEDGEDLSAEFGRAFEELLEPDSPSDQSVSPDRFTHLRGQAAEVVARTAGSSDPDEAALVHRLVATERRFLERVDVLRRAELAGERGTAEEPAVDGCSVTKEQVTSYLRQRLERSPGVVVEGVTVVPGGRSKETILVSVTGTDELPPAVVLRKDRPVGLLQTRAVEEYEVIRAVHAFGGVPVPRPYFAEPEGNALGEGTFLVMECVPGHKAGEFFPDLAAPTEHGPAIGQQLAAGLARLHALPLDHLEETDLDLKEVGVSEDSVLGMVKAIVGRINELSGPPCVSVPLAHQWLVEHVADVVPAPRVCLLQGDFGFHNMLVDGDRVTALVDWEAATVGPPARELAAAWNVVTSLMPWPAFVKAYVGAGGHAEDIDPRAVTYYRVLSALGGFMTSRLGGHMFRTGAKRDLLTAHSGLDSHFRCARNLSRALGDAIALST